MPTELVQYSMGDMEKLAISIAKSKLFGMDTPEQALALMAISQAEGLHPAIAARDYHIIKGRPTLKADAMLARFQKAGGKVEWHSYTDECCDATISHPQGGTVRIMWDMDRAKQAEISNSNMYKKYPRNMLRARVISEGIRTVFPGVAVGIYTPEEAEEFEKPKSAMAQWAETPPSMPPTIEHQPEDHLAKRAEAFMENLRLAKNKQQVTNSVATNNRLFLDLKEGNPPLYEDVMLEITQIQQSFDMAEAAE